MLNVLSPLYTAFGSHTDEDEDEDEASRSRAAVGAEKKSISGLRPTGARYPWRDLKWARAKPRIPHENENPLQISIAGRSGPRGGGHDAGVRNRRRVFIGPASGDPSAGAARADSRASACSETAAGPGSSASACAAARACPAARAATAAGSRAAVATAPDAARRAPVGSGPGGAAEFARRSRVVFDFC
jgi:hypothetical protein